MTKSKYDKLCEELKTKVNWQAFTWAFGIVIIIMGWLIVSSSRIETKIDAVQDGYTEIKTDIGVLKNDISWLRNNKQTDEKQAQSTTYRD